MFYVEMSAIKRRSAQCGRFFFSRDSMRFFASRVGQYGYSATDPQGFEVWADDMSRKVTVPGSRVYFVTSEQFEGGDGFRAQRKYTVRVLDWETGNTSDVSAFQAYASRSGADAAARKLAAQAPVAVG